MAQKMVALMSIEHNFSSSPTSSFNYAVRDGLTKKYYFQALPILAPLSPIRATWSSFFRRQKLCFLRMTEKSTDQMMIMMVEMIIMIMGQKSSRGLPPQKNCCITFLGFWK